MSGVNKVLLVGRLGKDPEIRSTQGGKPMATFSVATSEQWTGKDGAKQEKTEWHNIIVFGPQADACSKFLAKGREVHVEGKLQTRKWQDKEGKDRWSTEIIADRVTFLGGKSDGPAREQAPPPAGPGEDDVPL